MIRDINIMNELFKFSQLGDFDGNRIGDYDDYITFISIIDYEKLHISFSYVGDVIN